MVAEIPSTMRAARWHKPNTPYSIDEVETPKPAPYELLLKTAAAGFCASDWAYRRGDPKLPQSKLPMTASHEPTGTVVAKGDSVKGFSIGDRVAALAPINQCGARHVTPGRPRPDPAPHRQVR
jgi:D-arabinose 1-dehydrogenase-like Zn-dependent alcohol dehydrogenase